MLNLRNLRKALKEFKKNKPFDHCIVDDFLEESILKKIVREFPKFDSKDWHVYKNALEDKKTINSWHMMPKNTYSLFQYFNSNEFVNLLSNALKVKLYPDSGLHGGGWHCHGDGGNLNPHLDYSLHPKIGMERYLNLIIYVDSKIKEKHGGHLGFWKHNAELNCPGNLIKEIFPKYNRAVLFRTNQNSWHGLSRPLSLPDNIYRKSLAIYYLKKPSKFTSQRGKALYAPRENQKKNESLKRLIRLRSQVKTAEKVYRKT